MIMQDKAIEMPKKRANDKRENSSVTGSTHFAQNSIGRPPGTPHQTGVRTASSLSELAPAHEFIERCKGVAK